MKKDSREDFLSSLKEGYNSLNDKDKPSLTKEYLDKIDNCVSSAQRKRTFTIPASLATIQEDHEIEKQSDPSKFLSPIDDNNSIKKKNEHLDDGGKERSPVTSTHPMRIPKISTNKQVDKPAQRSPPKQVSEEEITKAWNRFSRYDR